MNKLSLVGIPSAFVSVLMLSGAASGQDASVNLSADTDGTTDASATTAGPLQHPLELGLFAGVLFPPGDHTLRGPDKPDQDFGDVAPDFGFRLGLYPLDFLGIEGEAAVMPTETDDGESANIYGIRVHAIGQVPTKYITPFLVVGTGGLYSDSNTLGKDSDRTFHFGIGAKIPLNKHVLLRIDGRDTLTAKQLATSRPHWPEVLLGLSFGLGGKDDPAPLPPAGPVDSDGDGLTDDVDRCPMVPANTADGCPIADRDSDGVPDPEDECPDVAGELPNGCPDLDADKDGVLLPTDICPDVPGIEPDGCPDNDPDKDGIRGAEDQCPNEPETFNGYEDKDGCPDEVPEKVKEFTGVIKGIHFATGKSTIRPDSFALLDRAAAVLAEYKDLSLQITGHTDSVGKHESNMTLSQERAASVKNYLVSKGVEDSRLKTEGRGPDEPIGDNKTAEGRQDNRRIEFKIIQERPAN